MHAITGAIVDVLWTRVESGGGMFIDRWRKKEAMMKETREKAGWHKKANTICEERTTQTGQVDRSRTHRQEKEKPAWKQSGVSDGWFPSRWTDLAEEKKFPIS